MDLHNRLYLQTGRCLGQVSSQTSYCVCVDIGFVAFIKGPLPAMTWQNCHFFLHCSHFKYVTFLSKHPVYCVNVVGTQNANNLITVSTDGRMCSWSLDMLSQPQVSGDTASITPV